MVFARLTILSSVNLLSAVLLNATQLKYVSITNQECKVRPKIINVNTDEPVSYRFSIKTTECSGSCNNINDPYAKMCVPDAIKNINVKVFNLMSRTNETRHMKWHETCKCKRRLDASVYNNKQRLNDDKCRCECKELTDKGICDKGSIWNPSNCECESDKSCDVVEYLDFENCKCRNKLIDKLVEGCTKKIEEAKIAEMALFEHGNKCAHTQLVFSWL